MNDRLKFRMYDTNVNKMYMPNDFEEVESIYECIKQQINWDLDVDYDIKFNHLEDGRFFMQCTGLKDKNGKLIYEGDILRFKDNVTIKGSKTHIAAVEHNEAFNAFMYHAECMGLYTVNKAQNEQYDVEVIGNIYENKSLLESEG